jgi:hypothetical protein
LTADRTGPTSQDQKGRLKGVIHIRPWPKQPPANTKNQSAVAAHQRFERQLIAVSNKTLDELGIAQLSVVTR